MRRLLLIGCAAACCAVSYAAEPIRIRLFPDGASARNGLEGRPERVDEKGYVAGVSDPELLVFLPDPATADGRAVLIVPGGAYEKICLPYEGYKTAEWLNRHGIAAAILKYRLPNPKCCWRTGNRRCA